MNAVAGPGDHRRAAGALLARGRPRSRSRPTPATPAALTGTLRQGARGRRASTLGYRESSVPFSYLSARGEPIGYSIELCRLLVEAIGEAVGRELAIQWLPVTSETRIDAVVSRPGRPRMRLDHQQPRAPEAGRLLADDLRLGHQAAGEEGLADQVLPRPGRQDRWPSPPAPPTRGRCASCRARFKLDLDLIVSRDHAESFAHREVRQGGSLRDRRGAAVRPDRAGQGQRPGPERLPGGRRLPVLRPLRRHVPQGRSADRQGGQRHLPGAGRGRRDRAPVQALVPAQACPPAPASTCR